MSAPPAPSTSSFVPKLFVRGDVDGFFGLALDNLIQVLVVLSLCSGVLGFSPEIIYGRMLPGISISLLIGNLFYSYQAYRLAKATGRDDVCALPYGINTVSLFAFVFLVMAPVKFGAMAQGRSAAEASELAFRAGVLAAAASGVVEGAGAWLASWLRRYTPRAAMLSTLAGIAVTFIAAGFFYRTFGSPLVSFLPLGVVLLTYFGRVRFPLGLPGGLVAITLGTLIAWATPHLDWDGRAWAQATSTLGFHPPVPFVGALVHGLQEGHLGAYFSVILPMGLFTLVGSLQNLESALAAGDEYDTVPSLVANGIGTVLGAAFGSPFPTTIYIGHPGWKALGARIGYSVLNAAFFTVLGFSGAAAVVGYWIPIEAGMAIVVWIGIIIVAQAFVATPQSHAPAVAVGLLPGIGAWGALMLKTGARAAGLGSPQGPTFGPAFLDGLKVADLSGPGVFSIEQGFLLSAMIWSALCVEIIERRFVRAALWATSAAALSMVGMLHAYRLTPMDSIQALGWGAGRTWATAYALLALLLLVGHWLPRDERAVH